MSLGVQGCIVWVVKFDHPAVRQEIGVFSLSDGERSRCQCACLSGTCLTKPQKLNCDSISAPSVRSPTATCRPIGRRDALADSHSSNTATTRSRTRPSIG